MSSNNTPPIKLGNRISVTLESYKYGLFKSDKQYALCEKLGDWSGCSSTPILLGKFEDVDIITKSEKKELPGASSYGHGSDNYETFEDVTTSIILKFEENHIYLHPHEKPFYIFEVPTKGGKRKSKSKRSTKKRVKKHNKTHSKK